jgi:methylglutaconyl-CoA hydratase
MRGGDGEAAGAAGGPPPELPVLWDVDRRGVATVTLNRPGVNNAYDGHLIAGLHAAMDDLGLRPGVRVAVVRGNGPHFQAGVDLGWSDAVAVASAAENLDASRLTAGAVRRLERLPVPTIALVHGGCFGGGTGLVAACDVAIAAADAVFAISETRWGLVAGIIVPQLADAMGVRHLRRYALTGERFDAAEARRIGLVHEVVPRADLAAAGARVVDRVLQNAPGATAETKAVILESGWSAVTDEAYERLIARHAARRQSPEAMEGRASFREKRAARWYPGPT